jgi:hypothetical protein
VQYVVMRKNPVAAEVEAVNRRLRVEEEQDEM